MYSCVVTKFDFGLMFTWFHQIRIQVGVDNYKFDEQNSGVCSWPHYRFYLNYRNSFGLQPRRYILSDVSSLVSRVFFDQSNESFKTGGSIGKLWIRFCSLWRLSVFVVNRNWRRALEYRFNTLRHCCCGPRDAIRWTGGWSARELQGR